MSVSAPSRALRVFFSYATSSLEDKELFDQLTTHLSILRKQNPAYEWYDSAISAGSPVTQFVEARMQTADMIILLISADYFDSSRCYDLEMQQALTLSTTGTTHLLPILLRPSDWQTSPLVKYSPLPSNGTPVSSHSDQDAVFVEVVQGIRRAIQELATRTPQSPTSHPRPVAIYNSPHIYNDLFTDRTPTFAAIATNFIATRAYHTPILALTGIGGIGKTLIALEYSYRSSEKYQAILWLNASSRAVLSTDVSALADQLSLSVEDREDESRLFAAFKAWLQDQSDWLLVLDQIEDLALVDLIIPLQSSGHVLLTTRTQATGKRASAIIVAPLDVDASTLFLLHRAKILPAAHTLAQAPANLKLEAAAIAVAMDGFPLALDQAGAYLEEKGCSLATYHTLYQDQRATLLSARGHSADDHRESVTSTLTLTFAEVARKSATNLDLLYLLAFLHPDAIPESLLTNGASVLREPLQSLLTNPLTLNEALADLRRFSLLHRGADMTTLQIHRVVQDVLINMLTSVQQRSWARQTVRLINRCFPEVRFDTWADCERYLPQAQQSAILISRFQLTLKEGAQLLERLGTYCSRRASYVEAEKYLTQALNLYEHHLRADLPATAQTLNSLGRLYQQQARYAEAATYHQRALEIRERVLGPDHPKTAESLHNLAMLYGDLGQYQRAEQIYLRVLALEEDAKGAEHPDIASTLNNLGLTYYQQGLYPQATSAYQRTLAIYERTLPANHPDLIYPLDGLGEIAEVQGDYLQAETLYQRALSISEHTYGKLHPETAHSINKLADIAELQGDYLRAETLYQQALTIGEQVLRPDHPDIALFLNNLAFIANRQGQYLRAQELYQRALTIYEQALGPEHPDVATLLNNLGQLFRKTGDDARAEELLRRASGTADIHLNTTHPDAT